MSVRSFFVVSPLPEVPGVVRVDRQRAAVPLNVSDDRQPVLRTVVALDEAGHHQSAAVLALLRCRYHRSASSPAACPGSPARRSSSPSAPNAASARSPGTADPPQLAAPVPETPEAAPGSNAVRGGRAPRPHHLPPRISGATDENPVASPRSALHSRGDQSLAHLLSTEMPPLSFRLKSICSSPGSRFAVDQT